MPSAQGLFHRAGVQSGSALELAEPERANQAAEALLAALNLSAKDAAKLQQVPLTTLLAAQASLGPAAGRGFAPVVGNDVLPHHPFDPVAPPESRDVPMIIGTTLDDAALAMTDFDMTEEALKKSVADQHGEHADRIYEMYRDAYPDATPYLVQARIATDRGFRRSSYVQAERKAAQGGAPAYYYLWEWPAPAFDGKFGAVHGVDVGLALHDYRGPINGGGSREGKLMADRFAGAWTGFAKSGKPDCDATPEWPAYDVEQRATMVFDLDTRVENDYRGDFRRLWEELDTA